MRPILEPAGLRPLAVPAMTWPFRTFDEALEVILPTLKPRCLSAFLAAASLRLASLGTILSLTLRAPTLPAPSTAATWKVRLSVSLKRPIGAEWDEPPTVVTTAPLA